MEQEKKQHHGIRDIILKDGKFYAPLENVVKFCNRFPKIRAEQIAVLIEDAMSRLSKDKETMKKVPKVIEDKNWFSWF